MMPRPMPQSNISNDTPALSFKGLNVGYGKKAVVSDVNFLVRKGQMFGLIGLNGVGKTTLIKTLLGLRSPLSGHLEIFGQQVTTPEVKSNLAYLPERFDPPHFLKGYEFLDFSGSFYKRKISREEMDRTAEQLDLAPEALARRIGGYSKGMRQKLGLAATMLTGCELLILDEPMSGLDPKARVRVKDALLSIHKAGRTIFLSSHILSDMRELCDDIIVVHGGGVKYMGQPQALVDQTGQENLERAFLKLIEE